MPVVLVTGGSGYIGSHLIVDLLAHQIELISVDNYSNSYEEVYLSIEKITQLPIRYTKLDLCDKAAVFAFMDAHPEITDIIHFAAHKSVPESVLNPLAYYENNIQPMVNLLAVVERYKIQHFVFSSSCSVYGNPQELPVTEESAIQPASPYAFTKVIGERMIMDFVQRYTDCRFHLLRYFNPAGNHSSALIGEWPRKTYLNVVPVITRTAVGELPPMKVFGDDYDTRDGSCVRDYVHVMDIAHAHTLSLQYLQSGKEKKTYDVFNLGTGQGVTTLEIIHSFERVSGVKLKYTIEGRREGDVASIFANNDKAKNVLAWTPMYSLDDMVKSAWDWELERQKNK